MEEDSRLEAGLARSRSTLTCPSCRAQPRPQAIRCPVCLTDFRGPAVSLSPSGPGPEERWSAEAHPSAAQFTRLATFALVIGSASLLWQVLGGLALGHLLAAAASVTGRGRGSAT